MKLASTPSGPRSAVRSFLDCVDNAAGLVVPMNSWPIETVAPFETMKLMLPAIVAGWAPPVNELSLKLMPIRPSESSVTEVRPVSSHDPISPREESCALKSLMYALTLAVMAAFIVAITAKVNAYINDFKAQLSSRGEIGSCELTGRSSVTLDSDGLIGISFNESSFTGGAHPATIAGSINFIVSKGATVSMGQLFIGTTGPAALSTQSRLLLTALLGPDGVDASFIDPGTTPLLSNFDTAWAFRQEGLEVTFQQYQVAPGYEGTPTIVIPWTSLKSVINPSGPAGPLVK